MALSSSTSRAPSPEVSVTTNAAGGHARRHLSAHARGVAGRDRGHDGLHRPVDLHHGARGEASHLDEVERDPLREQPQAVAESDRVHHQAVFVDHSQPRQRLNERRPGVRDDRLAVFLL